MLKSFLAIFAVIFLADGSNAHGGIGIERDPCVAKAGLYLVHFAAYQPQVDPSGEYCRSLPSVGNAVLVFDLIDRELRGVPAELRIVAEPEEEGASPTTVFFLPAKTHPNGVMSTEATINKAGFYTAIVTFQDTNRSIRFPIRVGLWSRVLVWSAVVAVLGIALGFLLFRRFRSG